MSFNWVRKIELFHIRPVFSEGILGEICTDEAETWEQQILDINRAAVSGGHHYCQKFWQEMGLHPRQLVMIRRWHDPLLTLPCVEKTTFEANDQGDIICKPVIYLATEWVDPIAPKFHWGLLDPIDEHGVLSFDVFVGNLGAIVQ